MKKLKMDKEGYALFLKEIEEVKGKLDEIRKYKGKVAIHQGDNWHDNPTLYSTESQEVSLMRQLSDLLEQLKNIEIVEKLNDESIVEIGDILNILLSVQDGKAREMIFKLVSCLPNRDAEVTEIAVDSPLGTAVYGKNIGDKVTYEFGDRVFDVVILGKEGLCLEEDKTISNTRKI